MGSITLILQEADLDRSWRPCP